MSVDWCIERFRFSSVAYTIRGGLPAAWELGPSCGVVLDMTETASRVEGRMAVCLPLVMSECRVPPVDECHHDDLENPWDSLATMLATALLPYVTRPVQGKWSALLTVCYPRSEEAALRNWPYAEFNFQHEQSTSEWRR